MAKERKFPKKKLKPHSVSPFTHWSRLFYAFGLILTITIIGTIGYYVIEKEWTLLDSLYMTVITLATVGYGETHALSTNGRVFTIVLILSSMSILGYAISLVGAFLLEGQLNTIIRGQRMNYQIASLKNHIVLCGGGRTGKHIAAEFYKTHTPFVVIEQDEDVLKHLQHILGDFPHLLDDATEDDTLLEAGIKRAKGLVAALGDDKDNVFIVLSARSLNPSLYIIARANEEENEEKLRKAGANDIVSPNSIGGLRIASLIIRPTVVAFIDEMMRVTGETLRFEEVQVQDAPALANKTLVEADVGRKTGLLVVGIKPKHGRIQFNPGGKTILNHDDVLVVLGTRDQINKLYDLQAETPSGSSLSGIFNKSPK